MVFAVKFALLFVGLAFVQSQLVVPKIDNLNAVLSSFQSERFLSVNKLRQLQNEIFSTIVTALGNHWDIAAVAQALKQLVTQYIPQVNQMDIDWIAVGQSALSNILSGSPGGRLRKRDLDDDDLQLLSQLSIDELAQIAEVATIPDRTAALIELQQLLQQFFPNYRGRTDFDDLAANLFDNLNNMLPQFNHPTAPIPN